MALPCRFLRIYKFRIENRKNRDFRDFSSLNKSKRVYASSMTKSNQIQRAEAIALPLRHPYTANLQYLDARPTEQDYGKSRDGRRPLDPNTQIIHLLLSSFRAMGPIRNRCLKSCIELVEPSIIPSDSHTSILPLQRKLNPHASSCSVC